VHPLDRPVWASLTTHQAALGEGGPLARRYARDVNLFASGCDGGDEAQGALAELVLPGERVFVLQVGEIRIPPGLTALKQAMGVQMVATRSLTERRGHDPGVISLGDADAPEMLALATLTQPGPFLARTPAMGHFRGVRADGRLAAMAGERMRLPGYTEVSGVCTHPDHRGQGLARQLSSVVAAGIEARGETPFLHAWETNTPAIALYASLGFVVRARVHVAVLTR
jgi:predicted GNAT family acetyltransferase